MNRSRRALGALVTAWVLGGAALAQEPQGPPPPSGTSSAAGPEVLELLPDLGKIGAQVGALAGASWNPYDTGRGFALAGFIDLPLTRAPGGKLSYEILLGFSDATDSRLRLLDASPFSLKYTLTGLDHARLRPYFDAGLNVVLLVVDEGSREVRLFDDDRSDRRLRFSSGASLELGFHAGGGFEVRVSKGISLNLDYRFTRLGGESLHAAGGGLGFHF
jgi:opacity protein-like surface antigen